MQQSEDQVTIKTVTPTPVSRRCPTAAEVLLLADTCFEMFSLRELRHPKHILPELHAAFPKLTAEQISAGIWQAIAWKRLLRKTTQCIN